ncbi:LysR family transcriptional regulator [Paraburkholderia sp. J12]|uniref:LysR family transcriptional regulator n=1 Tax=Paraburkholderia sp. J12 TaxID=2805432 RepID=UPI002ABD7B20|nr:LysR family transcriptional regulator [Paraburkholderia sp. J12]
MDRLTSMEVFVAVVDRGSFTAAAEVIGTSTTSITNHVQTLERRLGTRLLNRTTRRLSLTEIGRAFYEQCVDILGRVDAAEVGAREMHASPRGRLKVSAPLALGSYLLFPALADFLKAYPEIEVQLILNDRVVDLTDEGFDVAFRFGNLSDSNLVARPLRNLGRVVCAAPDYLALHGTPETPEDLTSHNCLAFHYVQPEREWHFSHPSPTTIPVSGQLSVNNVQALLAACLNGIGIAMLPDYVAAEYIDAGRLVSLFADQSFTRAPLQLVYLPDRQMTPKLRSFVNFVLERFA